MPTTAPPASSSGPPELPGLTAASVWTTPVVGKHTPGAVIWRSSWETTPVESDARFSNGLPITATGSPTRSARARPERQRAQAEVRRVDLQQRRVLEEVVAEHPRIGARAVVEHDAHGRRLRRRRAAGRRSGDDVRGCHDQPTARVDDEAAARRLVVDAEGGLDRDDAVARARVERDRVEAALRAAAAADDGRDGRAPAASAAQGQRERAAGDSRDERDDDGAREGGPRGHGFPV